MFNGTLNFSMWGIVGVGLILTHITIASVTIFLHRHQAHKALDLHPLASHFFRFWLWLTTGMITKEWVAVHRKHHAKCDIEGDPHSPQIFGLRKVLLEGAELYGKETDDKQTLEKYGKGTPEDWVERHLYSRFHHLGIGLLLPVEIILFGPLGLSLWAIQMLWIPFWAAGVINGLGHTWGYRSYETPDASTNIAPIGLLIGGEEFHNNHHAYPWSARLSTQWWELDIGWLYIRLLAMCKLARVRRQAPKTAIEWGKLVVDRETLRAVVQKRFHVMALYGRRVVLPALRMESKRADAAACKFLREVKPQMMRDYVRADEGARLALSSALAANSTPVDTAVYHFSSSAESVGHFQTLQWQKPCGPVDNVSVNHRAKLWRPTHDSAERHNATFCTNGVAESKPTGIEGLKIFAGGLRGYSMVQRGSDQ